MPDACAQLYRFYRPGKNGEVFMSVRMAADRLGVSPQTALRAFHMLVDRGFIQPRQRGSFEWKQRHATNWVLTEFEHGGQLPTKDFMRWRMPEKQNTVSPQEQTVSPQEQTVSPQEQMGGPTPSSVSPRRQIEAELPGICSPGDTQVSYQAGGYAEHGPPQQPDRPVLERAAPRRAIAKHQLPPVGGPSSMRGAQ